MRASKHLRAIAFCSAAFAAVSLSSSRGHAEEIFPPVIEREAGMPCVPTCTLCHTTNPGMAGTWVAKPFGAFMGTHGAKVGDASSIKAAFDLYKAAAMTDATKAAGLKALASGLDPDNNTSLCGPSYGCGAHVAKKAPPSDLSSPLWVVGAMVIGGLLRRRKREA